MLGFVLCLFLFVKEIFDFLNNVFAKLANLGCSCLTSCANFCCNRFTSGVKLGCRVLANCEPPNSKSAACRNNLKQIGLAINAYTMSNDDILVPFKTADADSLGNNRHEIFWYGINEGHDLEIPADYETSAAGMAIYIR